MLVCVRLFVCVCDWAPGQVVRPEASAGALDPVAPVPDSRSVWALSGPTCTPHTLSHTHIVNAEGGPDSIPKSEVNMLL